MKIAIVFFLALVAAVLCHDYPVISQNIIKEVNSDPKATWVAGENAVFKGKSLSQIRHMLGAFLVDKRTDQRQRYSVKVAPSFLPKEFDARTKWPTCIHKVRNQAQCGSCWAFSASEVLSDRFCIASKGQINKVLSPQDMVSCDSSNFACRGGYLEKAWEYLINKGIVTDSCFNYHSASGYVPKCPFPPEKCVDSSEEYKKYKAKGPIRQFADIQSIESDIVDFGPVQTGFRVYRDFFSYKSGVYSHKTGGFAGGHAVKIVGWGHDSKSGEEYWIVANSWGPTWGLDGFFWIKKGNNECDIEQQAIAGYASL